MSTFVFLCLSYFKSNILVSFPFVPKWSFAKFNSVLKPRSFNSVKCTLNVSAQNHSSKSYSNQNVPLFVLKGCPLSQTIVNTQALIRPKHHILLSILLTLHFVELLVYVAGSFFLDFYFSIKLFTSRSLIIWSYALNVLGFCSSHLKSNFRRPRLPDLLLFRGTLFLSPHKTCLVPATLTRFSQAFVWNFLHILITT